MRSKASPWPYRDSIQPTCSKKLDFKNKRLILAKKKQKNCGRGKNRLTCRKK